MEALPQDRNLEKAKHLLMSRPDLFPANEGKNAT